MTADASDTRILYRYIDRAGRYALSSLFGRQKIPLTAEQKHERVTGAWHRAVYALTDAGWWPSTVHCRQKLYNCPPFGKRAGSLEFLCGQRHVCPWCWCREFVRDMYLNLEDLYFTPATLPVARVVEGHTYTSLDADKYSSRDIWERLALTRKDDMHAFVSPNRAHGVWWQQTVEPAVAKGSGWTREYWRIHFRLLAIVPSRFPADLTPKAMPNDTPSTKRIARIHTVTSKWDLVKIAGSALRYPAGLLLGNPARVAALLNVRKYEFANTTGRQRGPYVLSGRLGVFRNMKFKHGVERPNFASN